jgi:hypothetical protein
LNERPLNMAAELSQNAARVADPPRSPATSGHSGYHAGVAGDLSWPWPRSGASWADVSLRVGPIGALESVAGTSATTGAMQRPVEVRATLFPCFIATDAGDIGWRASRDRYMSLAATWSKSGGEAGSPRTRRMSHFAASNDVRFWDIASYQRKELDDVPGIRGRVSFCRHVGAAGNSGFVEKTSERRSATFRRGIVKSGCSETDACRCRVLRCLAKGGRPIVDSLAAKGLAGWSGAIDSRRVGSPLGAPRLQRLRYGRDSFGETAP